jgi:hypothetical protein
MTRIKFIIIDCAVFSAYASTYAHANRPLVTAELDTFMISQAMAV